MLLEINILQPSHIKTIINLKDNNFYNDSTKKLLSYKLILYNCL